MAAFRFALQVSGAASPAAWRDLARKTEDLGYSTLYVPDHLDDQWAPMIACAVAAEATTTLRVGTLVLDNDFRHPVLVAKEAATLDVVTGGRFELGMGAGWLTDRLRPVRHPDGAARRSAWRGWPRASRSCAPVADRHRHLRGRALPGDRRARARRRRSRPAARRSSSAAAAGASSTLAGQYADIVSVVPSLAAGYIGPEVAAEAVADKYVDRVRWAREAAGERADDLELQCWTVGRAGRAERRRGRRAAARRSST